ncbi:MAG TPA: SRPBCC family protein [Elusimicrobiota bacterium]|jgi:uncharacterized protein YndB with AHSA1/START domain|nr:SRPBCC family protein [Elusimicrobiota bacterium]
MESTTLKAETVIAAPREKVFGFLTDPNKATLAFASLIENTGVPPLPLKVGSSFRYKYKMYGVVLEGSWEVTRIEPAAYEARTSGDASSTWRYSLEEKGGGTRLSASITYEAPGSLLQKAKAAVLQALNQKELEHGLQNMKTLLEMGR